MRERPDFRRRSPRLCKHGSDAEPCSHLTTAEQLGARRLEVLIGLEIRSLRKSRGFTVAELSVAAGISMGMLSKVENGVISPSLGTLDALATALSVPITQLFTRIDDEGRFSAEAETRKRKPNRDAAAAETTCARPAGSIGK
jgi:transcriptional regulator with XRE-family HTH domain